MSDEVFTYDMLRRAVDVLNKNNQPHDGGYRIYVTKQEAERILMLQRWERVDLELSISKWVNYRHWTLLREVLNHERRREVMGRRGHVTLKEVLARVDAVLEAAVSSGRT